jgi:hypothetical protein
MLERVKFNLVPIKPHPKHRLNRLPADLNTGRNDCCCCVVTADIYQHACESLFASPRMTVVTGAHEERSRPRTAASPPRAPRSSVVKPFQPPPPRGVVLSLASRSASQHQPTQFPQAYLHIIIITTLLRRAGPAVQPRLLKEGEPSGSFPQLRRHGAPPAGSVRTWRRRRQGAEGLRPLPGPGVAVPGSACAGAPRGAARGSQLGLLAPGHAGVESDDRVSWCPRRAFARRARKSSAPG